MGTNRFSWILTIMFIWLLILNCNTNKYQDYEYDTEIVSIKTLNNSDFSSVNFDDFNLLPNECPGFESDEYVNISNIYPQTGFDYVYGYKDFVSYKLVLASYANNSIKFLLLLDKENKVKSFFKACEIYVDSDTSIRYNQFENYILLERIINYSYDIVPDNTNDITKSLVLLEITPKSQVKILEKKQAYIVLEKINPKEIFKVK